MIQANPASRGVVGIAGIEVVAGYALVVPKTMGIKEMQESSEQPGGPGAPGIQGWKELLLSSAT